MRSEFRRLTGGPLAAEKFAFALPLELTVSDEEGQEDRLSVSVIVLAPAAELGMSPGGTERRPAASQATPPGPPPPPKR